MFRLLRLSVRLVAHRSIVAHIAMSTAVTGVGITIVTDSIAFPVTVGTAASAGHLEFGALVPELTAPASLSISCRSPSLQSRLPRARCVTEHGLRCSQHRSPLKERM